MQAILDFLSGKKTYIVAGLFAIFNFGVAMGYWTPDNSLVTTIDSLLGALGLSFLRAGVTKSEPK